MSANSRAASFHSLTRASVPQESVRCKLTLSSVPPPTPLGELWGLCRHRLGWCGNVAAIDETSNRLSVSHDVVPRSACTELPEAPQVFRAGSADHLCRINRKYLPRFFSGHDQRARVSGRRERLSCHLAQAYRVVVHRPRTRQPHECSSLLHPLHQIRLLEPPREDSRASEANAGAAFPQTPHQVQLCRFAYLAPSRIPFWCSRHYA
jgi:hypothetical protein